MLNAYMTDTVVLVRQEGVYTYGEKTTKEKTVRARIDYKNSVVRNFKGEETVSNSKVTIREIDLLPSDRVRVDGVEHPILSILKIRAFAKNAFLEVCLG